jgi:protein-glucosylgalactosylhydroxylysine glucosidase
MKRREFFHSASATLAGGTLMPEVSRHAIASRRRPMATSSAEVVDRRDRVSRHAPVVRTFDAFSALSVGNGSFAFTADATGLQTFADDYKEIPLATQAEWGWHSYPNPARYRTEDASVLYDAHGRKVPYASGQNTPAGKWLRENPHRLSLARIGFALRRRDGSEVRSSDLTDVVQRLDLWTGTLESRFTLDGRPACAC